MDVVFLDNHLFVVVKPPGQLVQADRTGDVDLLSEAKAYIKETYSKPGNVFLGLVHRIDRPASGLIVFARTSKAAGRLSKMFRERTVRKQYLVLVEGVLEGDGELRHRLKKVSPRTLVRSNTEPNSSEWKDARLQYKQISVLGRDTLLLVRLITGRKHQIRAQLAHVGHPIVGDLRYGGRKWDAPRALALHCARLGLRHPVGGEEMDWFAPVPDAWPETIREYLSSRGNYLDG